VETITVNTLAVLTNVPDKRSEWRGGIILVLREVQVSKTQAEVEFLTAILALLDGKTPSLSAINPYARALRSIVLELSGGNTGLN